MPGWVVYDKKGRRPYIRRFLRSRQEAEALREDLLRPYEPSHYWRRRISVHFWQEKMPRVYGRRSAKLEA